MRSATGEEADGVGSSGSGSLILGDCFTLDLTFPNVRFLRAALSYEEECKKMF